MFEQFGDGIKFHKKRTESNNSVYFINIFTDSQIFNDFCNEVNDYINET